MIKLLLVLLFLGDFAGDFNPLDYLTSFDKRATCQRIMKRFVQCTDPQTRRIFTQGNFGQRMIRECVKSTNRKHRVRAARCLRVKDCKKFNKCMMP